MFKFFDFLVNIVNTIWEFVSGGLVFLSSFFEFLMGGFTFINNITIFIPPFARGFLLVVLGISIVSLFLGHFVDW